jgi:hypothetical protein
MSPYELCETQGDAVQSSVVVKVTMEGGEETVLQLGDYLSIPPPRTIRLSMVKEMLATQHKLDGRKITKVEGFTGEFEGRIFGFRGVYSDGTIETK